MYNLSEILPSLNTGFLISCERAEYEIVVNVNTAKLLSVLNVTKMIWDSSREGRMLRQLLVGSAVSACNIVIHALVMVAIVSVARLVDTKHTLHPWLFLIAIMVATVSVLMIGHASEVLVWALAYAIVNAAPSGTDLAYFAFVNYATLGYGDITPVEPWRLLGPITAMNGMLLFGWSTAVIFEVLRRALMKVDMLS